MSTAKAMLCTLLIAAALFVAILLARRHYQVKEVKHIGLPYNMELVTNVFGTWNVRFADTHVVLPTFMPMNTRQQAVDRAWDFYEWNKLQKSLDFWHHAE